MPTIDDRWPLAWEPTRSSSPSPSTSPSSRWVRNPDTSPRIDWSDAANPLIGYAPPFNTSDPQARDAISRLGYPAFSASRFEEESPIFTPEGSHQDDFDQFGTSLTSVGDLDGNGTADIAVGAHLDDDGGDARGAVWVLFLNADGTVAVYIHLMQDSVRFAVGEDVEQGQLIAQSSMSGTILPHLHFVVFQNDSHIEGEDVPVNFRNAEGPLDPRSGLIQEQDYKALPF